MEELCKTRCFIICTRYQIFYNPGRIRGEKHILRKEDYYRIYSEGGWEKSTSDTRWRRMNIKVDYKEPRREGVDWIKPAYVRIQV
jgi:hypothetical protein